MLGEGPRLIRAMREQDLDRVLLNERAAYPIPWSPGVFESSLRGKDQCWVMEVNAQVIGHAIVSYVLDEAHLLNICVHPEFSGKGLGRSLLRFLIRESQARGASSFYLEVRVSNLAAIALYHSEGFNEVGVRPGYYPGEGRREDAMLMTLELGIDAFA